MQRCLKWNWQKVAIFNKLRGFMFPLVVGRVPMVVLCAVDGGAGGGAGGGAEGGEGSTGRKRLLLEQADAVWRVRSRSAPSPSIPPDQVTRDPS